MSTRCPSTTEFFLSFFQQCFAIVISLEENEMKEGQMGSLFAKSTNGLFICQKHSSIKVMHLVHLFVHLVNTYAIPTLYQEVLGIQ